MINGKETGWMLLSLFASPSIGPLSRTMIMPLMAQSPSTSWAEHAEACVPSACTQLLPPSHAPSFFLHLTLSRPLFLSSPPLFPLLFLLLHFLFHSAVWCQGHLNECLSLCASYFPKATWKERCHTVARGRECTARNVNLGFDLKFYLLTLLNPNCTKKMRKRTGLQLQHRLILTIWPSWFSSNPNMDE